MVNMCIAVIVMAILYGAIFIGAWKSELKVRVKCITKTEKMGVMLTAVVLFAAAIITIAHNSGISERPTGYVLGNAADFVDMIMNSDSSLISLVYFVIMPLPAVYLLAFSFRSLVEKYVRSSVPMPLMVLIGAACVSIYYVACWSLADLLTLLLIAIVLFVYSSGVNTRISMKNKLLLVSFAVIIIAVGICNLTIPVKAVVLTAEYAIVAAIIGWLWKKLRYFRKIWKAVAIIIILVLAALGQYLLAV